MPRAARFAVAAVATALASCGAPRGPAPLGNVVLYVDTDAPVPRLAGELRVDLFTKDGTWFATRDIIAGSPSSWPISFGVVLPDGSPAGDVVVRLRAFPEGKVRDYRGYRYQARPGDLSPSTLVSDPAPTDVPRILDASGNDVTPSVEPLPLLTIDRLLLVPLTAGNVGAVDVTLAGACFGTMADMRDFGALASCTDTEASLDPVTPAAIATDSTPGPSVQGAFEQPYAQPCAGAPRPPSPLRDEDVCITGGAFVFGSRDNAFGDATDDVPERVALVPSFYIDRYEVTVARMRAAGLADPGAIVNFGPLDPSKGDENPTMCTYSRTAGTRDDYPVSCIGWAKARAFCQHAGGDLPLEVQWEYAGAVSGRPAKTSYPWGAGTGGAPACTDVVYGRSSSTNFSICDTIGIGPTAVTVADHAGGDRTLGLDLVDFGGNMAEVTRDAFASFSSDCWLGAPLESPSCDGAGATNHATRGGAWNAYLDQLTTSSRDPDTGLSTEVGFRCVRSGEGS